MAPILNGYHWHQRLQN